MTFVGSSINMHLDKVEGVEFNCAVSFQNVLTPKFGKNGINYYFSNNWSLK